MPEMGVEKVARIRVMTTTERDALEAVEGMVIFNSTTDQLEEYDGSTWQAVGQVIMDTHEADGDQHALGGNVVLLAGDYNSVEAGTWSWGVAAGYYLYANIINDGTHADKDELVYKAYLPAGTYTLRMVGSKAANRGISDIDIDDTEVASFDWYAGSTSNNQVQSQTSITVATSGLKSITVRVDGKNASSNDYYLRFCSLSFWRTA